MILEVLIVVLFVAVPTFLALRWILKKFILNTKSRNLTSIIGTIILTPIIVVGLIYTILSYLFYEPQYNFNREKWFADKHSRFEMSDDIVESRMLIKKNKKEVIELIGKPENNDSLDIWNYHLGTSGPVIGLNLYSLELFFENGKVSDVKKLTVLVD